MVENRLYVHHKLKEKILKILEGKISKTITTQI